MKEVYVIHFCKNPNCNNAWLDVDLTNAKTRPPSWKYCDCCCKKYGFVNPKTPPQRKNYKERLEQLQKHKFKAKIKAKSEFNLTV